MTCAPLLTLPWLHPPRIPSSLHSPVADILLLWAVPTPHIQGISPRYSFWLAVPSPVSIPRTPCMSSSFAQMSSLLSSHFKTAALLLTHFFISLKRIIMLCNWLKFGSLNFLISIFVFPLINKCIAFNCWAHTFNVYYISAPVLGCGTKARAAIGEIWGSRLY